MVTEGLTAGARCFTVITSAGTSTVEERELAELEVNPLLGHPGGALALDAHGVRTMSKIGCVG